LFLIIKDAFALDEGAFIVAFILSGLTFAAVAMVGALVVWTSYLVTFGRTTYEKIKLGKLIVLSCSYLTRKTIHS
jgi:hypothetical protein